MQLCLCVKSWIPDGTIPYQLLLRAEISLCQYPCLWNPILETKTPTLCPLLRMRHSNPENINKGHRNESADPKYRTTNHIINTFRTSLSLHISPLTPPTGSLTNPFSVPIFSLKLFSRSLPYILPLGRTTGSSSTMLLVWSAYGTFRASSLSSVEHIGQTDA